MQNPFDAFGVALRNARIKKGLTQKELANKLNMSVRTIIEIELFRSNPKFETVALLARELDISLDAILFPDTVVASDSVSKSIVDFFAGKSEAEVQKYISLCQQADTFKTEK